MEQVQVMLREPGFCLMGRIGRFGMEQLGIPAAPFESMRPIEQCPWAQQPAEAQQLVPRCRIGSQLRDGNPAREKLASSIHAWAFLVIKIHSSIAGLYLQRITVAGDQLIQRGTEIDAEEKPGNEAGDDDNCEGALRVGADIV